MTLAHAVSTYFRIRLASSMQHITESLAGTLIHICPECLASSINGVVDVTIAIDNGKS